VQANAITWPSPSPVLHVRSASNEGSVIRLRNILRDEDGASAPASVPGADPDVGELPKPKPAEDKPEPKADKAEQEPKAKDKPKLTKKTPLNAGELKKFIAEQKEAETAKKAETRAKVDELSKPKAEAKPEPKDDEPDDKGERDDKAAPPRRPDGKFDSAKAEAAADKIEDAGKKVPEQKAAESDKNYELRLVQMAQKLRDAEAKERRDTLQREAAEKRANEAEAKAKALETRASRWKNREELLDVLAEEADVDFATLVSEIEAGKIKAPRPRAHIPPELLAKQQEMEAQLKALRERDEAAQRERQEAEQKRRYDDHVGQAKSWLDNNADDYPLLSAMSFGPGNIIQGVYRENNPDMSAIARKLEDGLAGNVLAILGSERGIKSLAKLAPKAKEQIAKAFGLALEAPKPPEPKPEAAPAVRRVSQVSTEARTPPAPNASMTAQEKREAARKAAKRGMREWMKQANGR
jgi:hypothetical protein